MPDMSQDQSFRKLSEQVLAHSVADLHAVFAITFSLLGIAVLAVGFICSHFDLVELDLRAQQFLAFASLGCAALGLFYGIRARRLGLGKIACVISILMIVWLLFSS